ncbi:hypothetical protein [Pseudobacillus wudalianchiensis]|uniref:Lipoprotein n=1 Tax=Pseudobacillus wudalianchiensis TaxID=1743143 RepID=A0A1B9AM63_9BACI|nr:hypothetical protein [Bacillus wudalianchiensis]OCA84987.1 hypothetical protein A8F95_09790 [Bacillus wudalianchiensis]
MKKCLLRSLIVVMLFSLCGCQPNTVKPENHNTENSIDGFIEPELSDWVKYEHLVTKYMYYRTQAVIHNDINILWNQYPDLRNDYDFKKGINVEKDEVESFNKRFKVVDANFSIEGHNRMRVKTINDKETILLVNGGIGYLSSNFDKAGGELLMEISLKLENNHWTIVKTDEYNELEYKEWVKKRLKGS